VVDAEDRPGTMGEVARSSPTPESTSAWRTPRSAE
jgi:hypothetical protein